jgi:hypothetical protein
MKKISELFILDNKNKIQKLIETLELELKNIQTKINELDKNYNEINLFIEICKVFEIYKWENIKINYKCIKRKINFCTILYNNITKLYSNIIVYYSNIEKNTINKIINDLHMNYETYLYNFSNIKITHKYILIKCNAARKSKSIIKIYYQNKQIDDIINKLIGIINNLKNLNNDLYNLKKNKIQLFYDINILSNNNNFITS